MAEIVFADGVRVVDEPYVSLIEEATNGDPSSFLYRDAMARMGRVAEKRFLRDVQQRVVSDHLRSYGDHR